MTINISWPYMLTISFLILKVSGFVNMSWWWVFSPIWISFLVTVLMFLIVVIFQCVQNKGYKL